MTPKTQPDARAADATPLDAPVPAKPRRRKPGRAVLLHNVDWDQYEKMLDAFLGRRNARLAYDRGDLEIMAPSGFEHQGDGCHLGLFADTLTDELGLPLRRGGSVTLKSKKVKRGIEPDKCYWIANAAKLAGVRQLDLAVHPPPDLAIEVDVTNSSIDRFGIYAKLGVGEVWRLDGDELRFYQLGANKKYAEVATSPTFAGVTPANLMGFVTQARGAADQNMVTRAFRGWVRQRVAQQPPAAPPQQQGTPPA